MLARAVTSLLFAFVKIRLILLGSVAATHLAFAGRFDLPQDNPQFSIQMPEKWHTEVEGDNVSSRPAKDSRVTISVFSVSGAKNLQDAFAIMTNQVSATYRDVKVGKLSEQKQAGLTFFGGQGEAEKDGFELRLSVAAFTADGQRYFALAWVADEVSGDAYLKEINETLASIQRFKKQSSKEKK